MTSVQARSCATRPQQTSSLKFGNAERCFRGSQMNAKYLPISRATGVFGLSKSTIYRAAKTGQLEIRKVGRSSLVSSDSLARFLDSAPRLYAAALSSQGDEPKA